MGLKIKTKYNSLHPDSRTLYPESGNKEQGLEKRNQGTGYGVRDTGCGESVVVVLQRRCFFSELRVITLNN
jgi:hypothetical protein